MWTATRGRSLAHVVSCRQRRGGSKLRFFCGRHKWMSPKWTFRPMDTIHISINCKTSKCLGSMCTMIQFLTISTQHAYIVAYYIPLHKLSECITDTSWNCVLIILKAATSNKNFLYEIAFAIMIDDEINGVHGTLWLSTKTTDITERFYNRCPYYISRLL